MMTISKINKIYEDAQTVFISGISIPVGGAFEIKDQDGFPILQADENGDLKLRGGVKRI